MAWWNSLSRYAGRNILKYNAVILKTLKNGQIRTMSGHHTFQIQPSRWQWDVAKDMFHLYFMVGMIPVGIVVFCANVFIGPATLEPIPEGYVPKYWEYVRHPISRFYARYVLTSPQQEYEKYLHVLKVENDRAMTRRLQIRILRLAWLRTDYQGFYYKPSYTKYMKRFLDTKKGLEENYGN